MNQLNKDQIKDLANLYDIKTLSQAITDKGWAFTCKSTRQDLVKIDVPTIYADILDKYNNADKGLVTNENNTAYAVQYDSYSNKFIYKPKSQNKLYSSDLVDLSNPTDLGISDVTNFFMLGQNINIVRGNVTSSGSNYYIYSKDWELIRTINLSAEYNSIGTCRYVDGAFLFLVNDNDNFHRVCYLIKFDDNINVENPIISNNFKLLDSDYRGMNISDIIDDKIYITCASGSNGWYSYFLEINFNNLSYINIYESNIPNNTYNNYANITKYDDKYYFGSIAGVYQSSDLVNWTLIYSLTAACYYIEKINNIFYIICNGYIITTEDFITFNVIISFTGGESNYDNKFVNCYVGNNTYIFNFKNPLYLYCLEAIKTYTDTYVIDGNNVEIDYCKNGSYKICLADNTNDTNLATVYSYLGYYNYYRLDTTNETVSLPRNSNLYSMMYVGDNYQDTLDGITGNATRLLEQSNLITDMTSTSITFNSTNKVQPNTDYEYGELTTLTLDSSSIISSKLGTTIKFQSGTTATTIVDNSNIHWADKATPEPSASKTCLIFIWDNTGFYKEL